MSSERAATLASERTGERPRVAFVHANGFCKEVWRPVVGELSELRPDVGTVSVDLRGHGDSPPPGAVLDFDSLTADLLATIDERGLVGVGHSSGGTVIARAQIHDPSRFSSLVLIEPIIFPPPHARMDHPLAQGADRRRRSFASRDTARTRFATGPFASWTAESLDAYCDHGFRQTGDGWTLKCDPHTEAEVFRQGANHDTWDHLDAITVPVRIVVGEHSNTHREPYVSQLASRIPDAEVTVVSGAGHFVPMEAPHVIASIVERALGEG